MTTHKFEHPLNEKTRIYLRVEALLNQMEQASQFRDDIQHQLFFRSLFDLLEILSRSNSKANSPKISKTTSGLPQLAQRRRGGSRDVVGPAEEIDDIHRNLMGGERFGQSLKEDRFSVRFASASICPVALAVLICRHCTIGCIWPWNKKSKMPASGWIPCNR